MKYSWNTENEYKIILNALVKEQQMELDLMVSDGDTFEARSYHIDRALILTRQIGELDSLHKQWLVEKLEKERKKTVNQIVKGFLKKAGVA